MNHLERRTALAVTVIFGLRMLGLFSLMPVLSVLASDLNGATVFLAGVSVGVYGLTQSVLQIPMGWLSDRWGRKPVILLGLLIFAVGSVVAAQSDSIWGVIVGRALQGAGAIASALLALVADAARPEYRTRLMAMVGASIGLAFSLAFALGPKLGVWLGLSGLFYFSCACALLAALVVFFGLPVLPPVRVTPVSFIGSVKRIMRDGDLLRLDISVFVLHTLMTALFVVLPLMLTAGSYELDGHTSFYLPCVLLAFALMAPAIYWSEKRKRLKPLLVGGVGLMGVSLLLLGTLSMISYWVVAVGFTGFFIGFNLMEASLPSAVGKSAPSDLRGVAMGVFSSSQFFGAFTGGVLAGTLLELLPAHDAFYCLALVCLVWWAFVIRGLRLDHLSEPRSVVTQTVS